MSYEEDKCKEIQKCMIGLDVTCCTPKIDTFLAVTEVKPGEPERPQKTRKKIEEIEQSLVECLHYPMLWDIPLFDDNVKEISTEEKLNRINSHLVSLYTKKEKFEKEINNEEKSLIYQTFSKRLI